MVLLCNLKATDCSPLRVNNREPRFHWKVSDHFLFRLTVHIDAYKSNQVSTLCLAVEDVHRLVEFVECLLFKSEFNIIL
jgi:hypothetical protein